MISVLSTRSGVSWVYNHGGKWYAWDSCMVIHTLQYLLYFKRGDYGKVYGFCTTNVISGDEKFDQDILVNDVFYLWVIVTTNVLLEISIFVRFLNILFIEKILITRDRTNKICVGGKNIVIINSTGIQIVKTFLTLNELQKLIPPRCTYLDLFWTVYIVTLHFFAKSMKDKMLAITLGQ